MSEIAKRIDAGEPFDCKFNSGIFTMVMLDRVMTDHSAGQYEPGWWICEELDADDPEGRTEYFLSANGIVYRCKEDEENDYRYWDHEDGVQPELLAQARERAERDTLIEAEYEALAD